MTERVKLCVFVIVGEVVEALTVTLELPVGVFVLVLIVTVTLTGLPAPGFIELEGEKLQWAPFGKPLQES